MGRDVREGPPKVHHSRAGRAPLTIGGGFRALLFALLPVCFQTDDIHRGVTDWTA